MRTRTCAGTGARRLGITGERPDPVRSQVRRAISTMSLARATAPEACVTQRASFVSGAADMKAAMD